MAKPEQKGIKWWKYCQVCQWTARSKGVAGERDNANTFCPNCNNPILNVAIDENVFNEKRYDVKVRNGREQGIADAARAAAGLPAAPPDTINESNSGHNFGNSDKPFPDPP